MFMTQGPFLRALTLGEPEEKMVTGHVNQTILFSEDLLSSEINT